MAEANPRCGRRTRSRSCDAVRFQEPHESASHVLAKRGDTFRGFGVPKKFPPVYFVFRIPR
jgi:hypothetical protein